MSKAACPICGRPSQPDTRPFCSARCRMVDLGRWLDGSYRIEVVEDADDSPDAPQSADLGAADTRH
jgi:endogenous inhibitor of DNA gyrase (YacG/DUF329 family)